MMKKTSFFLFLILMLNLLIFIPSVSALEFSENFDDYLTGDQVSNSWFTSETVTPFTYVVPINPRSGLFSYTLNSADTGDTEGYTWFNFTDIGVMETVSAWVLLRSKPIVGAQLDTRLYAGKDGEDNAELLFTFNTQTGSYTPYMIPNGAPQYEITLTTYYEIRITKLTTNSINVSLYNDTGDFLTGHDLGLGNNWDDMNKLYFIQSGVSGFYWHIDDLLLNEESPFQEGTIYLKLFDLETGERLYTGGLGTGKAWMLEPDKIPNVRLDIRSDLLGGFSYNPPEEYGYTITISDLTFVNGDYHFINLTSISGFVAHTPEFQVKHYLDSINYFQFYAGQTYTIYVSDSVTGYGGYSNCKTGQTGGGFTNEICTDKRNYVQGESINIRYKAMDPQSIIQYLYGFPYSGYQIWIYDRNDLGWWWQTDGGESASQIWDATQDNQYHFQHWDYSDYGNVTGGINGYKLFLAKPYGGLFGSDVFLVEGPNFWITFGDFTAHGNITSISPSEPMLGQFVTIGFEANNNGYLTVKNRLAPDGQELMLTSFMKFDGIGTISKQFWEFGSYELNLYVEDETGANKVDTDYFDITDVNGSFGDFGFGIEFLTVEPERPIAGYDTVFVNYRSMDATGEIKVVDARDQTTSYGAVVGEKRGVLNITLPSYAAIGVWNVTLTTANNTLYSSFNVIATENNWIEFYRNVYSDQQAFNLKLKHDKKVEIVFLKNGVEMGKDWFLEVDQLTGGVYDVPGDIVQLSPGKWTVELYEVNFFIKMSLLATDECIVVEVGPGSIDAGYDDIFSIIAGGADSIASGGFGLAFIAIMFILIVIVSLAKYNIKNDTIFFGTICMALFMAYIGWLPIWIVVIAIILSGFLFSSAFSKKLKIGS